MNIFGKWIYRWFFSFTSNNSSVYFKSSKVNILRKKCSSFWIGFLRAPTSHLSHWTISWSITPQQSLWRLFTWHRVKYNLLSTAQILARAPVHRALQPFSIKKSPHQPHQFTIILEALRAFSSHSSTHATLWQVMAFPTTFLYPTWLHAQSPDQIVLHCEALLSRNCLLMCFTCSHWF